MPISPPTLQAEPATPWCFIALRFPMAEAAQHMDLAIQEVLGVLARQQQVPAGPLTCRHLARPTTHFDLQLGFPVAEDLAMQGEGRVEWGTLPATWLLRTTYTGPYEGLAAAWGAFSAAVPAALASHPPMEPTGCFRERYLTDPSLEPDPARWATVLELELRDGAGEK
jgi:effector-binding domain-containing protein